MITSQSTSKEWIERVSEFKKADKILVEKVIRAFVLLEGLRESGLDFIFKGGTALMLLFGSSRRLSIDIDIILPNKELDLSEILEKICKTRRFTRCEKQDRNARTKIKKDHYKFFFISSLNGQESTILLDVLREDIHYKNTIERFIESDFVERQGAMLTVKIPDYNNLLGDKLTAFAPNTTGIPYRKGEKEMGMEIIKQMYDIGCLCDYVDNPAVFSEVFSSFAEVEIAYRDNTCVVSDVLDDVIESALSVCLRQTIGNANFDILSKGIVQVKSFVFSESFHLEKAISYAAKTAYLAALIKYGVTEIRRFNPMENMGTWNIQEPMNTKLNKIKKTNPEAFHYLYQIWIMQAKG